MRFEEEQKVFKAVYYAIQDTLLKAELIANSETKITGKLEKGNNEIEEKEEKTNSIADLFRKIAKNSNTDKNFEQEENNAIESIYRSKIQENNGANTQIQNDSENEEEKIEEEQEEKDIVSQLGTQNEIKNDEAEINIENKEEIKNTIDEFMKMGASLTAEQIREKIAQISLNAKPTISSMNSEIKENAVKEEEEKYETRPIKTEDIEKMAPTIEDKNEEKDSKIEKLEETTPGSILANIAKERSEEQENTISHKEFEEKFDDMYAQIFGKTVDAKKKEQEEEKKVNAEDIINSNSNIIEESEEYKDTIPYKFIGIAFRTYIILEIENELYILDQHAAHERIMYEKVKKNYYSETEKDSQLMLLPDIITLTHKEMDIARDNLDKFEKAGFVLEEFGENTIKLTGVPNICLDLDTKELFLETLDEINTVARTAKQEIEERFIATIACKAAVKANMALTEEEVTSLLEQLLKLPNPFTCPHGRPTAIKLSKSDIEKKFARRK